jgi:ribosomal protein L30/L7E
MADEGLGLAIDSSPSHPLLLLYKAHHSLGLMRISHSHVTQLHFGHMVAAIEEMIQQVRDYIRSGKSHSSIEVLDWDLYVQTFQHKHIF